MCPSGIQLYSGQSKLNQFKLNSNKLKQHVSLNFAKKNLKLIKHILSLYFVCSKPRTSGTVEGSPRVKLQEGEAPSCSCWRKIGARPSQWQPGAPSTSLTERARARPMKAHIILIQHPMYREFQGPQLWAYQGLKAVQVSVYRSWTHWSLTLEIWIGNPCFLVF